MHDYRKLKVWQAGRVLVRAVYGETAKFPRAEQYGLVAQTRTAAVSVPSNIADGSGRGSDREYARFVGMSIGSACELETLIILGEDLGYLSGERAGELMTSIADIRRMLTAFRKRLRESALIAATRRKSRRS